MPRIIYVHKTKSRMKSDGKQNTGRWNNIHANLELELQFEIRIHSMKSNSNSCDKNSFKWSLDHERRGEQSQPMSANPAYVMIQFHISLLLQKTILILKNMFLEKR